MVAICGPALQPSQIRYCHWNIQTHSLQSNHSEALVRPRFSKLSKRTPLNTGVREENRFDSDASRYATYLQSSEGRLRTDLAFANVQDSLPKAIGTRPLRALDIGSGTGEASLRLARLGAEVTMLDSSMAMLELARQSIVEAGVRDRITVQVGDAAQLAKIFSTERFDIILCHNVLEYLDDPGEVLRDAARLMRNSSAILSALVRNQAGEVMKAAIQAGDLTAAEHNLNAEWGQESLYGGKVRLFTPDTLHTMMKDAALTVRAERGVRVISDYLPPTVSRSEEYERIFTLERLLGMRQEFFGVARYLHVLAQITPEAEVGA